MSGCNAGLPLSKTRVTVVSAPLLVDDVLMRIIKMFRVVAVLVVTKIIVVILSCINLMAASGE